MSEGIDNSLNCYVEMEISKDKKGDVLVNGMNRSFLMGVANSKSYIYEISKFLGFGLSYYESVCQPRKIKDISKIQIGEDKIYKIIGEIFTCTFCMSVFNDPVNLKNCLHKFCKKCIQEYNRTW